MNELTTVSFYSVADIPEGQALSGNRTEYPAKVVGKCDYCEYEGIEKSFKCCPNCGREIIESIIIDETIGYNVDLLA